MFIWSHFVILSKEIFYEIFIYHIYLLLCIFLVLSIERREKTHLTLRQKFFNKPTVIFHKYKKKNRKKRETYNYKKQYKNIILWEKEAFFFNLPTYWKLSDSVLQTQPKVNRAHITFSAKLTYYLFQLWDTKVRKTRKVSKRICYDFLDTVFALHSSGHKALFLGCFVCFL